MNDDGVGDVETSVGMPSEAKPGLGVVSGMTLRVSGMTTSVVSGMTSVVSGHGCGAVSGTSAEIVDGESETAIDFGGCMASTAVIETFDGGASVCDGDRA